MEAAKKIEIVISATQENKLYDLLDQFEIKSYTLIDNVKGKGERGWQDASGLTDAFTNIYLLTTCQHEEFEKLKEPLRKLLERSGGVCIVTDSHILKH